MQKEINLEADLKKQISDLESKEAKTGLTIEEHDLLINLRDELETLLEMSGGVL